MLMNRKDPIHPSSKKYDDIFANCDVFTHDKPAHHTDAETPAEVVLLKFFLFSAHQNLLSQSKSRIFLTLY